MGGSCGLLRAQRSGDVGRQRAAAAVDVPYRIDQRFRRTALGQVARGAETQCLRGERRTVVHREHHDAQGGQTLVQALQRRQAAEARHRKIEDQYIRRMLHQPVVRTLAVAEFGDDLDGLVQLQQAAITGAHHGMVIGQRDPERGGWRSGRGTPDREARLRASR